MNDENRLDRIEALIESNARAIEASRQEFLDMRKQWELDRSRLYQTMAELANSQANFYQAQASFYQRLQEVDEREERFERQQGDIVEILKLLTQQNRSPN
jgi:septal ring factor EnvC (AmiA/AmiB activator)